MKSFYATRSYRTVMSLELVWQYISYDAACVGQIYQEDGESVSGSVKKYEDKLFFHEEDEKDYSSEEEWHSTGYDSDYKREY